MKYVIGNWKAHKTLPECNYWLSTFVELLQNNIQLKDKMNQNMVKVIICPPAAFVHVLRQKFEGITNLEVGLQNISIYEEGSYTGEDVAKHFTGSATHVVIGHSERRITFGETEEQITQKIAIAHKYELQPILCIRDNKDTIDSSVKIVAYEPVDAIGTGHNMEVHEVITNKQQLVLQPGTIFLYGGSVTQETAAEYLKSELIDGLLIGGASLLPESFLAIVNSI